MTTAELVAQVERAAPPDDAVLLLTGTGMPTLRALGRLGTGNERVLLTSNLCGAWWALTQAGHRVALGRRARRGEAVGP